jgi:hypothetical protein
VPVRSTALIYLTEGWRSNDLDEWGVSRCLQQLGPGIQKERACLLLRPQLTMNFNNGSSSYLVWLGVVLLFVCCVHPPACLVMDMDNAFSLA